MIGCRLVQRLKNMGTYRVIITPGVSKLYAMYTQAARRQVTEQFFRPGVDLVVVLDEIITSDGEFVSKSLIIVDMPNGFLC